MAQQPAYPVAQPSAYPMAQQQRPASGIAVYHNGHSPVQSGRSPAPAGRLHSPAASPGHNRLRGRRTWRARAGSLIIAGCGLVGVAWYVPHVMDADHSLLTGTVISTGVVTLNFASSGQIGKLHVQLGATVHKGELLATEYAPQADSVVSADKAAVAAELAKIAQLKAQKPAPADQQAQIEAARAQLAEDQALQATDELKLTETEIVAPSNGTIVAVNGAAGEVVTDQGVKEYATDSQEESSSQRPAFSLLPEGPQSVRQSGKSGSSLPIIALRTSDAWQVVALIPEDSASGITAGTHVLISVPAANVSNVAGTIQEVVPTPVSTTEGVAYQAVVSIDGNAPTIPLDGMAADVRLAS
jgi:multidrug efflux pump subunit AcrA (membrane-fusion protein)